MGALSRARAGLALSFLFGDLTGAGGASPPGLIWSGEVLRTDHESI
jgi:hypothetical protein